MQYEDKVEIGAEKQKRQFFHAIPKRLIAGFS
jgi:hypothetical protein